jgi:hypothetical protein
VEHSPIGVVHRICTARVVHRADDAVRYVVLVPRKHHCASHVRVYLVGGVFSKDKPI